ncbi:excinuclease ABC subunit UvrC [Halioxenophilus sp. WMMB6]|uniref:excinuclease ABC subunit UvrC n=1 Tax=Halioxenophilus sp. WMMB6 TaxID=3073815 RepID=UPI00295E578E|nr:excinuclease ABC subunit UvrC [Halioxenophilus sp. WMMB6]
MSESSTVQQSFDHKRFLANTAGCAGVYQMFDGNSQPLYVGKAKNLKKRLSSYFRTTGLTPKTEALVKRIASIQVTPTQTETEALILEQNLIKSQRPPYNILLRDDKSYPYVFLSKEEAFPRISLHRGAKKAQGRYFGPFPNVSSVRESLSLLQKTFRVRQCEDSVFYNRTRPCLQYQIDRCKGPCVGLVEAEEYQRDVRFTELFLEGKSQEVMGELVAQMEAAAGDLEFEKAARYRDQITALRKVQAERFVEGEQGDLDVFAIAESSSNFCIHVLFIRQGRVLGSKSYFPQDRLGEPVGQVLSSFVAQYYLGNRVRDIPGQVILPFAIDDIDLIAEALRQLRSAKVEIKHSVRGMRQKWLDLAGQSAQQNLLSRTSSRAKVLKKYEALQEALGLDEQPARMECFDISHSSGEKTVASCVVFDEGGSNPSDYRRFNIAGVTAGDDYGAMRQALTRRYKRLQEGEGKIPDLLIVDGGKGQFGVAKEVLEELGVMDIILVGIAKGSTRKAGFETLILDGGDRELSLDSTSLALHLLQEIRDEAHRFAITGHRARRDKARTTSSLESVPGVGAKRRRELLRHFGGIQGVKAASVEDLSKVTGISRTLAEQIYQHLQVE